MQINIHQARLDEKWKNSTENSKRNWDVDIEKGFYPYLKTADDRNKVW